MPKEEPVIKLKDGMNLDDLLSGNGVSFEVNFEDCYNDPDSEEVNYNPDDLQTYLDSLNLVDEDCFQPGSSFDLVKEKSKNLTEDGKVKKRIIKDGMNYSPPDLSEVTIHYNAYIEFQDEPFDSTYARKRPHTFRLNNSEIIVGLDIAVKSMKIDEKSQFLIDPDYAFGSWGCLPRIPKSATVLYEVHLLKCVNSGGIIAYNKLDEDSKSKYSEIFKLASARCAKGNDLYSKNMFKHALFEYNSAASKLEKCNIPTYDEQKNHQELLLRINSNMLLAYVKNEEPRKACKTANIIYKMCKGTSLKVPIKVYFNDARALKMLSEYERAYEKLKCAEKMEPQNKEIAKELILLNQLMRESRNKEANLVKLMFQKN